MNEIKGRVKTLAECQRNEAELSAMVADRKRKWDIENADLVATLEMAQGLTKNAKLGVDELALELNKQTGQATVCTGVVVRTNKVMVYDAEEVLRYALERMPDLLKFNTTKFKKMWSAHQKAKARADKAGDDCIPFFVNVTEDDKRNVSISKDLSAYLSDSE